MKATQDNVNDFFEQEMKNLLKHLGSFKEAAVQRDLSFFLERDVRSNSITIKCSDSRGNQVVVDTPNLQTLGLEAANAINRLKCITEDKVSNFSVSAHKEA